MSKKKAKRVVRRATARIAAALTAQSQDSIEISKYSRDPSLHAVFAPSPGGFVAELNRLASRAGPLAIPYEAHETARDVALKFLQRRQLGQWRLASAALPSRWTQWGWVYSTSAEGASYELRRPLNVRLGQNLYRGRANRLAIHFYVSVDMT